MYGRFENGNIPWNLGKHHSAEARRKIKEARARQIISEETIKKIALINKGKKSSKEFCERSRQMKLGTTLSEAAKQKIRESNRRRGRGLSSLNQLIRGLVQYDIWRMTVFKRDGFVCIWCGSNKKIVVDHIKPFAIILRLSNIKTIEEAITCKELWDISNGRTLCNNCHKTTNTYGYRKIPL